MQMEHRGERLRKLVKSQMEHNKRLKKLVRMRIDALKGMGAARQNRSAARRRCE